MKKAAVARAPSASKTSESGGCGKVIATSN
jgi:hypothetical protein